MEDKIIDWAHRHGLSDEDTLELMQLVEQDREDAVKNADAAGYIRGKNEKIEIENRFSIFKALWKTKQK